MSDEKDLEERLAALEAGGESSQKKEKPSPKVAIIGIGLIAAVGFIAYLSLPEDKSESPLPTARPAEFQDGGQGFGAIEPYTPPPPPEPEVVKVENASDEALRAQLEALQTEISELRNRPTDDGSTAALEALTAQVAGLQAASEAARAEFQAELAARDQELRRLQSELEIAKLDQQNPLTPTKNDEDTRLAELERRRAEAAAFQEARIKSPMIAFGNAGAANDEGDLSKRTLDAINDFVLNGASPAKVTQAEVIANPSNTIVQGTMIQAVTETALDSSLPGQIRAIISEDVHSFDGSRVLIPRGARLIGRYRSGLNLGQRRITVAWDRIILPSNQTVAISSFGGDELGRSGVTGFVDTRFGERFGSAALISILGAAPAIAASQIDHEISSDVAENIGDDLQDATDDVISDYLSLGPVIYVDQGARITVMVDRDLEIF